MTDIFRAVFIKDTFAKLLATNEFFKRVFSFIREKRIVVKACSLCMIGISALAVSLASSGFTLGFNVRYSGEVIATIQNASVFNVAKSIALNNIASNSGDNAIEKPEFILTLTVADKLDNAYVLADQLREKTNDVVSGYALVVDGETIICSDSDKLDKYLTERVKSFDIDGAENTSEFADSVEIVSGYYVKSDISDIKIVKDTIAALPIKTISVKTTESEIPFSSKTVETSTRLKGYSEITTPGVNGISSKTESIEMINGETVSSNIISQTVLKTPVEQVTTIGTANTAESAAAHSAGLSFPLNCSYTVSAYFGDGRNHKGIDLAAKSGNSILAAKNGKVIFSGYDGDYGYSVVIDHGNGLKTRYAHASSLNVAVGDTVSQGDLIALVGSTGYSTGNHLHFEVIVNGTAVNPAAYIGIE